MFYFAQREGAPALPTSKEAKQNPLTIGVVFCGRQAPGGHNVVAAIYDGAKEISPGSKVYGFVGGESKLNKLPSKRINHPPSEKKHRSHMPTQP